MVVMKERLETMQRLGDYYIPIWDECDPNVAQAITVFRERWKPYSMASRRYPILRLVEELIDPVVIEFAKPVLEQYPGHSIPGSSNGPSFSELARIMGFDTMVRNQKECLRRLMRFTDHKSAFDRRVVATCDSLIDLSLSCAAKRPKKSRPTVDGVSLNAERRQGFCRFCGNPTEMKHFLQNHQDVKGAVIIEIDQLRLSHQYCGAHRPKLISGEWNPAYKQAERSKAQFELELARLYRQCAKRGAPQAESGNPLVDKYFQVYISRTYLCTGDKPEIRNLARKMVDLGLTDRKKEILTLRWHSYNQSQIAEALGVSRQSVSKALRTIPSIYHL